MTRRDTTILAYEDPDGTDKPYLGDPAVIDGLVRGYVMGIWDRAVAAAEGTTTGEAAAAVDQVQAQAFMKVIAGRDPRYVAMGGWNANQVGGLRACARKRLKGVMHPAMLAKRDGPYEALAAYFMQETYRLLGQAAELTEETMQDRLDSIFDDGQLLLLGLPTNQEIDETLPDVPARPSAG